MSDLPCVPPGDEDLPRVSLTLDLIVWTMALCGDCGVQTFTVDEGLTFECPDCPKVYSADDDGLFRGLFM